MDIKTIAYMQGIADWFRYKNRPPIYWKGTPEGALWQEGHNYAARYNNG